MFKSAEFLKEQIRLHKAFLLYGIISVFVTLVDISVCRISEIWLESVAANTIGVITGFIIQYFLTARHVYNKNNLKSFIVFLWTFFVGLVFANSIVYIFRTFVFVGSDSGIAFMISKGFSIVLPFFLMYFLRKKLMPPSDGSEERN